MPPPKQPTRAQQPATSGLGQAFASPIKRRSTREQSYVVPLGNEGKRRHLAEQLRALQAELYTPQPEVPIDPSDIDIPEEQELLPIEPLPIEPSNVPGPALVEDPEPTPRRVVPDKSANSLYNRWARVLPGLVNPLLSYITATTGKVPPPLNPGLKSKCFKNCGAKTSIILCLFHTRKSYT